MQTGQFAPAVDIAGGDARFSIAGLSRRSSWVTLAVTQSPPQWDGTRLRQATLDSVKRRRAASTGHGACCVHAPGTAYRDSPCATCGDSLRTGTGHGARCARCTALAAHMPRDVTAAARSDAGPWPSPADARRRRDTWRDRADCGCGGRGLRGRGEHGVRRRRTPRVRGAGASSESRRAGPRPRPNAARGSDGWSRNGAASD